MSSQLFREFKCDYMYGITIQCSEVVMVKTGSLSYGTDNSRERRSVEEAGWTFGNACKVYCPEHSQWAFQNSLSNHKVEERWRLK